MLKNIVRIIKEGLLVLQDKGLGNFIKELYYFLTIKESRFYTTKLNADYQIFLEQNKLSEKDIFEIKKQCKQFTYKPLISIIVPVYNVAPQWLKLCIDSVKAQYYDNWELCLYDDKSTNPNTLKCLKDCENTDSRIHIKYGNQNLKIAKASNQAIAMAKGEFIALLDNDDELSKDALFEVVKSLNKNPEIDFIYSDEDKIEPDGTFSFPAFKPDFNLDLQLSVNYICHLSVIRKTIGDKIGWFRKGFEGAQDFDLFLRIISNTNKIHHINKILYHWRRVAGSTASHLGNKDYATNSGIKALNDYYKNNNINAQAQKSKTPCIYKSVYNSLTTTKITIAILLKNDDKNTIHRILNLKDSADKYSIETIIYTDKSLDKTKCKIISDKNNYLEFVKTAIQQTQSEHLLLMNSDIKIDKIESVLEMSAILQRQDLGAIGGKITYKNKIYHAGLAIDSNEQLQYIYQGLSTHLQGYQKRISLNQNLYACSIEFLMIKRLKLQNLNKQNATDKLSVSQIIGKSLINQGLRTLYYPLAKAEITKWENNKYSGKISDIYHNSNLIMKNNMFYLDKE